MASALSPAEPRAGWLAAGALAACAAAVPCAAAAWLLWARWSRAADAAPARARAGAGEGPAAREESLVLDDDCTRRVLFELRHEGGAPVLPRLDAAWLDACEMTRSLHRDVVMTLRVLEKKLQYWRRVERRGRRSRQMYMMCAFGPVHFCRCLAYRLFHRQAAVDAVEHASEDSALTLKIVALKGLRAGLAQTLSIVGRSATAMRAAVMRDDAARDGGDGGGAEPAAWAPAPGGRGEGGAGGATPFEAALVATLEYVCENLSAALESLRGLSATAAALDSQAYQLGSGTASVNGILRSMRSTVGAVWAEAERRRRAREGGVREHAYGERLGAVRDRLNGLDHEYCRIVTNAKKIWNLQSLVNAARRRAGAAAAGADAGVVVLSIPEVLHTPLWIQRKWIAVTAAAVLALKLAVEGSRNARAILEAAAAAAHAVRARLEADVRAPLETALAYVLRRNVASVEAPGGGGGSAALDRVSYEEEYEKELKILDAMLADFAKLVRSQRAAAVEEAPASDAGRGELLNGAPFAAARGAARRARPEPRRRGRLTPSRSAAAARRPPQSCTTSTRRRAWPRSPT